MGPTGKVSWGRWWQERSAPLNFKSLTEIKSLHAGASLCLSDHTESSVICPGWQTWRGTFTNWRRRGSRWRGNPWKYNWKYSVRLICRGESLRYESCLLGLEGLPWDSSNWLWSGQQAQIFESRKHIWIPAWPLTTHMTLGQIHSDSRPPFSLWGVLIISSKQRMMPEVWNLWNLSLPASWNKGSIAQALEVGCTTHQFSPCKLWWYGQVMGSLQNSDFSPIKWRLLSHLTQDCCEN